MINIISILNAIEKGLDEKLSHSRYQVVSNAFGKASLFLYKPNESLPYFIAKIPLTIDSEERCLIE